MRHAPPRHGLTNERLIVVNDAISCTKRQRDVHRANMKRGILIGLLALFVLLCTCTVGSAVQEQNENGIMEPAGSMMEVEANKKEEEELQDAEASEDDATELMELQEQSEAELERRKKKGGGRSRGGRSRGGRSRGGRSRGGRSVGKVAVDAKVGKVAVDAKI
eukprot:g12530.t1